MGGGLRTGSVYVRAGGLPGGDAGQGFVNSTPLHAFEKNYMTIQGPCTGVAIMGGAQVLKVCACYLHQCVNVKHRELHESFPIHTLL